MPDPSSGAVPYCGAAPLPDMLLRSWNWDPWLLAAFAALAATRPLIAPGPDRAVRRRCFDLAFLVLLLAFVSPLCALSSALFSARVAHHLVLISLAAPLLALAFPRRVEASGRRLPALVLVHVVAVWVWHAPAPYAAALGDDAIYWLMELTLLGTAVLVWRELTAPGAALLRTALAHLAIIALMGLLGALITFAPAPLYAAHFLSTEPYGLSALEDQQLAGLLMWVPAILPNLLAALAAFGRAFAAEGEAGA